MFVKAIKHHTPYFKVLMSREDQFNYYPDAILGKGDVDPSMLWPGPLYCTTEGEPFVDYRVLKAPRICYLKEAVSRTRSKIIKPGFPVLGEPDSDTDIPATSDQWRWFEEFPATTKVNQRKRTVVRMA